MSDGVLPWLIGGAAVGVGFLWWRSRQAAAETKPDPCAELEKLGVPRAACELGLPVVSEIVQGVIALADEVSKTSADVARWDLENKALNGPVRYANEGIYAELSKTCDAPGNCYPALDGTVVEFENGCVPIKGAAGWEKCAPGTHGMLNYPIHQPMWWRPDGVGPSESWSGAQIRPMSAAVRIEGEPAGSYDPYTRGGYRAGTTNFPIPIPEGHYGYFYKGRPFTCAEGSPPALRGPNGEVIRDQRTLDPSYIPPCGASPWTTRPEDDNVSWDVPAFSILNPCSTDPANFTWDKAADGTPFCRRKMAGEP